LAWPDESIRWFDLRARAFRGVSGTVERVVATVQDVTEFKRAEEQARLDRQELERRVTARTAALQESHDQMEAFVYSMSHDLRSPLRSIEGFAQALVEDYAPQLDATAQDFLQRIRSSAQRLDALIRDLVDYTRLQQAELLMLPVSLELAIDEVLGVLRREINAKQAKVTVDRPLPRVMATTTTLSVVLANLLSNALKFVANGVRPEVVITAEIKQHWVRLNVRDNGIGIDPAYQERIFRVFERLHGPEVYAGTGIGLALVSKGIERMGGRFGVDSALGSGSCFWIELPKAD